MIELNVTTMGRPELLTQQIRLLNKYLLDEYQLKVWDNTPGLTRNMIETICRREGIPYTHTGSTDHDFALNLASLHVTKDYFGFLDHDIFPTRPCQLIKRIDKAGFYGLPQTHKWTGLRYLWPGFCFFKGEWLGERRLNFCGIRANEKEFDGDCGSMNHFLFKQDDWNKFPILEHSHKYIRDHDDEGLQSWGYEMIGGWVHFTNASHWKAVPDPKGRDRLLMNMIECL